MVVGCLGVVFSRLAGQPDTDAPAYVGILAGIFLRAPFSRFLARQPRLGGVILALAWLVTVLVFVLRTHLMPASLRTPR